LVTQSNIVQNSFLKRFQTQTSTTYIEEGRGIELKLYPDYVKKKGFNTFFFGEEIFHSAGKYSFIETTLHDESRILHSDYANLLYGSGIIGISFYLLLFLIIIFNVIYLSKGKHEMGKYKLLFFSIVIPLLINGFSDGILAMSNRAISFYLIGSILGIMWNRSRKTEQPNVHSIEIFVLK
jgi:hypothetical protein